MSSDIENFPPGDSKLKLPAVSPMPQKKYDTRPSQKIPVPAPRVQRLPEPVRPKRNYPAIAVAVAILLAVVVALLPLTSSSLSPLSLPFQSVFSQISGIPANGAVPISLAPQGTAGPNTSGTSNVPIRPIRTPPPLASANHFTGGFGVESDAAIANAADNGVQAALNYGYVPIQGGPVDVALKAAGMKTIDAMPWEYLHYYECHLNSTCSANQYPELTSVQAVLNDLTAHLELEQNNATIIGYWVLDDWTYGTGTGKDILIQMNDLIHQYTPGKPSICGFAGGIPPLPRTGPGWNENTGANFSPQGCDMVALYIYADNSSSGTYDWSMSAILPAVFTSLKNRGWSEAKEPLIGVPQAFGGQVEGVSWPVPDANSVETQSKAYCQQGAIGIIYYNWGESEQSPMTNPQIALGVKNGIADCEQIWN